MINQFSLMEFSACIRASFFLMFFHFCNWLTCMLPVQSPPFDKGIQMPCYDRRLWKLKLLACLVDVFCPQLNEKNILPTGYYFQSWVSWSRFQKNPSDFRESGEKYRKVKFSRGMVTIAAFEGLFFLFVDERSGWFVTCRQILLFLLGGKKASFAVDARVPRRNEFHGWP